MVRCSNDGFGISLLSHLKRPSVANLASPWQQKLAHSRHLGSNRRRIGVDPGSVFKTKPKATDLSNFTCLPNFIRKTSYRAVQWFPVIGIILLRQRIRKGYRKTVQIECTIQFKWFCLTLQKVVILAGNQGISGQSQ